MALNDDQNPECPLCMEPFEMDDLNFFPCTCGYQICRFCWHRIRTDENGLCPACRKQYPEDPADFKPLSAEELQKIKSEKRQKDQQRKLKMSESRKHLANVRVVQKNLVFVVGLPTRLADADVLKKHDYFGKFGKMHKVVVNQSTSYAGSQGPSASAYVTYCRSEDALRAIKSVNNIQVDGRILKASLGTTKYCSHFLKNQQCPKTDCMYLHELGDEAASFTKEDMQHGKHQEYEKRLQDQMIGSSYRKISSPTPQQNSAPKETWPCSVQSVKEPKQAKSKDSGQGQKSEKGNRLKSKHSGDSQRSKKGKCRASDSSHNSANMNKLSNKEDNASGSKRNQKQSRHTKDFSVQSQSQIPLQRLDHQSNHQAPSQVCNAEKIAKKSQTTFVEIKEIPTSHSSANIKITRSASPSLPPSPASSSSSSLFTPFGSFSSNILSSSPSPPPSTQMMPFKSSGNVFISHETETTNTYAAPSSMEMDKQKLPYHISDSPGNSASLFSNMNNMPLSSKFRSFSTHLSEEENACSNYWIANCQFGSSLKQPEDDLDFDPWDESSKGLADLMAKEANSVSYNNTTVPPGLSYANPIPSSQRLSVPPPGFNTRQSMQIPETSEHIPANFDAFNSQLFMHEKRTVEAVPQVFYQQSHMIHANQTEQIVHQNSCDINAQMKEILRIERQGTFQDNFRALFPNINVSFGSQNVQKNHNQNDTTWNSSIQDFPWFCNDGGINSGNVTEGQRNNAGPYLMKALQQLKMEDSLSNFNGHSSYSTFALRGQWPSTSQCPPPGFAHSRSQANAPFPHMQVNHKI